MRWHTTQPFLKQTDCIFLNSVFCCIAGKSTLLLTLLDLVPLLKGSVTIDDVSLSQIHPDLRHKVVGVLPQVPLVMRGWTVRQFLDPAVSSDCVAGG